MKWNCTYRYLRRFPQELEAQSEEELERRVTEEARRLKFRFDLIFEGYTDELHVFFRDGKGKRRAFAYIQCEG